GYLAPLLPTSVYQGTPREARRAVWPLRRRCASRADPTAIPPAAVRRWARRQTISQSDAASRFRAGNPRMTGLELQPKRSRAAKAPAGRTEIRDPDVPDCAYRVLSSSRRLHFPSQRLSKFLQAGADPRLHGSKRLIQVSCRLFISQFREKCGFDCLSLFRSQGLERPLEMTGLLFEQTGLLRINNVCCRPQAVRIRIHSLLPLIEPQAINRSAARLIHDPSDDGSVGRVIGRGFSPDVIENVKRNFLCGFSIHSYCTINVKTIRCVCSNSECSASWSPPEMARSSFSLSSSGTRNFDLSA